MIIAYRVREIVWCHLFLFSCDDSVMLVGIVQPPLVDLVSSRLGCRFFSTESPENVDKLGI